MTHMIEIDAAGAHMAYAGETPWHKLGFQVSNDLTPQEMLEAAMINWTVSKYETFSKQNGAFVPIPNRFALCRDTDGQFYDIVSDLYTPVQPEAAFTFFKRFVEAGHMKMETAGSLQSGKRIWGLASIESSFTLKGGDQVKGYLLIACPYELGRAFEIKFTTVRVVCHNTLTCAMGGKAGFQMAHWHTFDQRQIDKAEDVLGIARHQLDTMQQASETMAAARITDQQTLEYLVRLTNPKLLAGAIEATEGVQNAGSSLDAAIAATAPVKQPTVDDLNRAGKTMLESILNSPGSDLASARGTWWGALNGVTHAIDHKLGRNADSRLNQAWFGHREGLKQRAYDYALQAAISATN